MSTAIIVIILIVIAVFALRSSAKHVKGDGGCCGGGSGSVKEETAKLEGSVVAEKEIKIEGMHCENCVNSVMRQLQKIDGVSADVSLKKKRAVVRMDREVSDDVLRLAVERVGYQVVSIR